MLATPMKVASARPLVVYIVTSPLSLGFLRGQLEYVQSHGFDVAVISGKGTFSEQTIPAGVIHRVTSLRRNISLWHDCLSFVQLTKLLLELRPSITNVSTPKAGLLGTLAATITRVPCRIYTLRGLRFETVAGLRRSLLVAAESLICALSHSVVCVSSSLRQKAIHFGLVSPERAIVLENGTSNGIDVNRFAPTLTRIDEANQLRRKLAIPSSAVVVGFVGRVTRDKGVHELLNAFWSLKGRHPEIRLLLVGGYEEEDPFPPELRRRIAEDSEILHVGFVADSSRFYQVMDILALPTYREGFPNVVLEAQAAGIPVITTNATGASESIVDGVTGIRISVGSTQALEDAIERLASDPSLRREMGRAGAAWVSKHFHPESIWRALTTEYQEMYSRATVKQRGWRRIVKVALDRTMSGLLLLLLSPVMAAITVLIRLAMGSPVLFRQQRPGLYRKPFVLLKFRTMCEARDRAGELLPDEARLTRLGRLIRSSSLDELPQLINILRGELSFVGPRPLLMEYLDRYDSVQIRRHDVLPGLTGWAQVNGRNSLSWHQKFAYDVWYVNNWSLWLDAQIGVRTLLQVCTRRGISQPGYETMPKFTGNTQSTGE